MFKVAFPWATKDEEDEEREYLKGLETADSQEVAGNIWVSPEDGMSCFEVGLGNSNLVHSTRSYPSLETIHQP